MAVVLPSASVAVLGRVNGNAALAADCRNAVVPKVNAW